jgi:hypothetical protein
MNHSIHEAKRLLRRAHEINPEAASMAVKAINELAQGNGSMTLTHALLHVNEAIPGAALSDKEKELLEIQNG